MMECLTFPIFASHLQAIVGRSALGQSLACCACGFAPAGRPNLPQIPARILGSDCFAGS